ncbi:LysR family transcriptional regulator [Bacteroides mediterraneensis]|uniref:LysR family transcriptional regulator n=1 Tax=Bacteroides mediterraneensis TaxID=1841856 RepID=UPI00093542A3|nr:LysR family transcriptional regulator [Bacteroides mediterraneensis]
MSDFRLKAFYSVARNLSFTKASQELFVSQPAVTKHVRELESLYGVRLFDRKGNSISLTEAGKLLMEHCERILADYRKLEYDMHQLNNEYAGELRLGASTTISQYVLPPVLAAYTERYPQMSVSLMDTNSRNVEKALQEHTIDVGMVEGVFRLPNLRYEPFLCDELVPVVCPRGRWAGKEELTLDEFTRVPLVLRERGSGTLDAIEMVLAEQGLKLSSLNVRMHLGSTEGIKSFLRCSDCMGIVSVCALGRELKAGDFQVIDIEGLQFKRHFCFVSAQGQEADTVLHFMRFVRHFLAGK